MSDRGLFEPDVLITDQLVAARRRRAALSNEKRLMLAVLENALDDYRKYIVADDRIGRELFAEAVEWIACPSNEGVFSFENISETLDINPEYLRRGIAAWHRRLLDAPRRPTETPATESPALARAAG
ncbi:MAG: hypothetical protein HYR72_24930 [Deltaproteobacteria bacterium]|nr:hypothetical protein [Deltaproteobacteria bacterium]MBI3388544.1 hypothetical protein [Deltaproteobacteria bacterium]